ncbi:MAG: NADH-quinone oxidoreductase subunit M [Oligoflexia bacterium]|nr:NADH-quinone oxidoreductase subunit M [Oligoflexia bacterium]
MILSLVTFLPLVVGLVLLFFKSDKFVKIAALLLAVAEFVLSLALLKNFDSTTASLQFVEKYDWIPQFGISYFIGLDGISLWLILLTTFLTPIIVLASWNAIDKKIKAFHAALFILQTAMLGAFVAIDSVLFFVFWELMLVPMFLLVGIWGGEKRIYAAYKFFIYTMVGSIFMLVAIITLMAMAKTQLGVMSASLLDFYKLQIPLQAQHLMFLAFALAFAIKVPIFPLHTWLPDAHVQAPTPGSVILAGVLLKLGTYGFIRFAIPLFPLAVEYFSIYFIILGVFGIIYGALVAMVQPDMKKLVAYSSVSHLGYCVLGIFALNTEGVTGSLYQMLNHGISTGALFLLVGMIYERTHSREIANYGGLAKVMPLFAIFFFITTLSSIAVPGTNGFVGEFLILLGAFKANKIAAALAATGMVLGAVYMLWMYKRIFFGLPGKLLTGHHELKDLNKREVMVLVPLMILIFVMGIFPNLFLDKTKASIEGFLKNNNQMQVSLNK